MAIGISTFEGNNIFVNGESDGKLDESDYILFYGQSPNRWFYNASSKNFEHILNLYSDTTFYFLTFDGNLGKRISQQSSSSLPATHTVTGFDDYVFHETENVNLLKSGKIWLGETFDITTSYNFSFSFKEYLQIR